MEADRAERLIWGAALAIGWGVVGGRVAQVGVQELVINPAKAEAAEWDLRAEMENNWAEIYGNNSKIARSTAEILDRNAEASRIEGELAANLGEEELVERWRDLEGEFVDMSGFWGESVDFWHERAAMSASLAEEFEARRIQAEDKAIGGMYIRYVSVPQLAALTGGVFYGGLAASNTWRARRRRRNERVMSS